jgi:hypothetical protein
MYVVPSLSYKRFDIQFMIQIAMALLGLLSVLSSSVYSDEGDIKKETPRNRVDFTSVYFDTVETDRFTGILGYTRNLSSKSNLAVRLSYLDSRLGISGGSGFGDTTVTYSYLPNAEMSVGPWLPRIVGSGISVTLPTGNENKGLGLGSTILTPFLGTQLPLNDSISFTPTLAYAYSTDQIITGQDVRVMLLDLGLTWVGQTGWWASAYFGYIRDFETDHSSTGGRLSIGKVFPSRWGFSAHFIDLESFRPGLLPPENGRFNQVYELTLLYGF